MSVISGTRRGMKELETKYCPACESHKTIANYFKNRARHDGYANYCKTCLQANKAKWALANAEKKRLSDLAYRDANKEKTHARGAKWRAENKERDILRHTEYRKQNPEKVRAVIAAWAKTNPEKRIIAKHTRRARERNSSGKLSVGLFDRLFRLQRGKCACCKIDLARVVIHRDHIDALANGGLNVDTNIQLLCQSCNNQKSTKHPVDFMQSKGYLL